MDIATPDVQAANGRLRRIPLSELKKELTLTKEPLVVMSANKPIGIVYPYSKELDQNVGSEMNKYKAGEVTYDQYIKEMIAQGMQALEERRILIRPTDIIMAENLEETKRKNRMDGMKFIFEAAQFWGRRHESQLCTKCGGELIPKTLTEAEDFDFPIPEGQLIDGPTTPALN